MASYRRLHYLVLQRDVDGLRAALSSLPAADAGPADARSAVLDERDAQGNTALHLAIWLANDEYARLLIDAGASMDIRNNESGRAFDEALATGNCALWCYMKRKWHERTRESMAPFARRWASGAIERPGGRFPVGQACADVAPPSPVAGRAPLLATAFGQDGLAESFCLRLRWGMTSWIPLLRLFMPSDDVVVRKCGRRVRVDFSFAGMKGRSAVRRPGAYVLLTENREADHATCPYAVYLVDSEARQYRRMPTDADLNEAELLAAAQKLCLEPITLLRTDASTLETMRTSLDVAPAKSWFGYDVFETIGGFYAQKYTYTGVNLTFDQRTEHLSDEATEALAARQRIEKEIHDLHEANTAGRNYSPEEVAELLADIEARRAAVTTQAIKPYTPVDGDASDVYARLGMVGLHTHGWRRTRDTIGVSGAAWFAQDFPITMQLMLDICTLTGLDAESRARAASLLLSAESPCASATPVKLEVNSSKLGRVLGFAIELTGYFEGPQDEALFDLPTNFERVASLPWPMEEASTYA